MLGVGLTHVPGVRVSYAVLGSTGTFIGTPRSPVSASLLLVFEKKLWEKAVTGTLWGSGEWGSLYTRMVPTGLLGTQSP